MFGSFEKGLDRVRTMLTPSKKKNNFDQPRTMKNSCNISNITTCTDGEKLMAALIEANKKQALVQTRSLPSHHLQHELTPWILWSAKKKVERRFVLVQESVPANHLQFPFLGCTVNCCVKIKCIPLFFFCP